ncbi:membrane-targeted effector domain-containing toxin [Pantoea sp. B65]|uniref:membrane-targeted effector domain-containing toxin n=1 Tax=Pantoea sp. B65 TaxID=2813359 RepID=UPI0039B50E6D
MSDITISSTTPPVVAYHNSAAGKSAEASNKFDRYEITDAKLVNRLEKEMNSNDYFCFSHANSDTGIRALAQEIRLRRDLLLTEAKEYFNHWTPSSREVPNVHNTQEMIGETTKAGNGMVFASNGETKQCHQFLIKNMQAFADAGVKTLYMEHLIRELHQDYLDAYADPAHAIPDELASYLDDLTRKYNRHVSNDEQRLPENSFRQVVEAAHQAGINIVAIGCAATALKEETYMPANRQNAYLPGDNADHFDHPAMQNFYASRVIEHYQQQHNSGKFIALTGISHLNTTTFGEEPALQAGFTSRYGPSLPQVAGIAELTASFSVLITKGDSADGNNHAFRGQTIEVAGRGSNNYPLYSKFTPDLIQEV